MKALSCIAVEEIERNLGTKLECQAWTKTRRKEEIMGILKETTKTICVPSVGIGILP